MHEASTYSNYLNGRSQRPQSRLGVVEEHLLQGGDHGHDDADRHADHVGRHENYHSAFSGSCPAAVRGASLGRT